MADRKKKSFQKKETVTIGLPVGKPLTTRQKPTNTELIRRIEVIEKPKELMVSSIATFIETRKSSTERASGSKRRQQCPRFTSSEKYSREKKKESSSDDDSDDDYSYQDRECRDLGSSENWYRDSLDDWESSSDEEYPDKPIGPEGGGLLRYFRGKPHEFVDDFYSKIEGN